MRRSNVALRLQESLLDEVRRVSQAEGVALNQFINVAVAEKLSVLRTEDYFRERGRKAGARVRGYHPIAMDAGRSSATTGKCGCEGSWRPMPMPWWSRA